MIPNHSGVCFQQLEKSWHFNWLTCDDHLVSILRMEMSRLSRSDSHLPRSDHASYQVENTMENNVLPAIPRRCSI